LEYSCIFGIYDEIELGFKNKVGDVFFKNDLGVVGELDG
jgi:hypothetical protein